MPTQIGNGIHFRQFSRAFILADSKGSRVVFINADICMGSQIIKLEVRRGFTFIDLCVLLTVTVLLV